MAKLKVPYLALRAGRPRWVPGASVRARGFKGQDLRYPHHHPCAGDWMTEGDAVAAARALNAGLAAPRAPAPARAEARTMAALFARLKASPKFQTAATAQEIAAQGPTRPGLEKLRLGKTTLTHYRYHMKLMEEWCGDIDAAHLTADAIEAFYHDQAEARGLTLATAMMRTLKMALNYGVKRLRWLDFNPVVGVRLISSEGRCVIWEEAEIGAILAAADWCGLPSIGDAFVLGVLTGQRKQDILVLPEGQVGATYTVVKQKKRGATAFVPLTAPLKIRLEAMRARKASTWPGINSIHRLELINSDSGQPYHENAREFGEQWRLTRAIAAGAEWAIGAGMHRRRAMGAIEALDFAPVPSCAAKLFMDTRDTAVTFLFAAGCNIAEIANITGHSLKTVQQILDRHYFTRNAQLAASAGVKLDAHLETLNIRWA